MLESDQIDKIKIVEIVEIAQIIEIDESNEFNEMLEKEEELERLHCRRQEMRISKEEEVSFVANSWWIDREAGGQWPWQHLVVRVVSNRFAVPFLRHRVRGQTELC